METQLNLIAEQEPWKNLSKKYFGIHSYLKEAISKTIMFDIQPELFLDDNNIDSVVMYLLNNHQRDLLAAMKNVSTFIMRLQYFCESTISCYLIRSDFFQFLLHF